MQVRRGPGRRSDSRRSVSHLVRPRIGALFAGHRSCPPLCEAGQGAVCRSTSTRQARGNTVGSLDKTPFTSRWARLARQPAQPTNAHSQPHGSQTNRRSPQTNRRSPQANRRSPQADRRSPQADHTARLKMPSSTTVDDKRMAFKVTFSGDLQHSNNITL